MREMDQEWLKELLLYNPETGEWTWLKSLSTHVEVGQAAGTISHFGYRIITIGGTKYRASRLAVLYMTGSWPRDEVDHIDRCKLNDRWDNLRDVSRSENALNRDLQSNNVTGVRGVHWCTDRSKWHAQIKKDGINHFVGQYDSFDEAVAARDLAATELHGNFAVLNKDNAS